MKRYTDPTTIGLRVRTSDEVRAILSELRCRLEALYAERLRGLYLFGSYARGEAEPGSDVDVLVVLDSLESHSQEIQRTSYVRSEIALEHDTTISLVYFSEEDFRHGEAPILLNVRREGWAV